MIHLALFAGLLCSYTPLILTIRLPTESQQGEDGLRL